MSRDFNNTAPSVLNEYLEYAGAVISGYPATIACWFYPNDVANSQDLVMVGTTSANTYLRLNFGGASAGDPVRAVTSLAGTTGVAASSAGVNGAANAWYHAAAVFTNDTSRDAFFNGGSKGSNATSVAAPTGMDRTNVACGMYAGTSRANPLDGAIAEVGFWDAALTDAEIASLATGLCPLLVRPGNLVAYYPIVGRESPENSRLGAEAFSITGTCAAFPHPRVCYPRRRQFRYGVTAAGGTAFPWHYYAGQMSA